MIDFQAYFQRRIQKEGIQLLGSHFGGKGGSIKMQTYANREGGGFSFQCKCSLINFGKPYPDLQRKRIQKWAGIVVKSEKRS